MWPSLIFLVSVDTSWNYNYFFNCRNWSRPIRSWISIIFYQSRKPFCCKYVHSYVTYSTDTRTSKNVWTANITKHTDSFWPLNVFFINYRKSSCECRVLLGYLNIISVNRCWVCTQSTLTRKWFYSMNYQSTEVWNFETNCSEFWYTHKKFKHL